MSNGLCRLAYRRNGCGSEFSGIDSREGKLLSVCEVAESSICDYGDLPSNQRWTDCCRFTSVGFNDI